MMTKININAQEVLTMIRKEVVSVDIDMCIGCDKCIRNCPQFLANRSYMDENGDFKVELDHEECVLCGECIRSCSHEARTFVDDTTQFLSDLEQGRKIAMIVAPAFMLNYEKEYMRVFGWLKKKGVRLIYDVSFGADITTYLYVKAIKEKKLSTVIAQPCPVIVNSIEHYYPNLLPYLSPVGSPMHCAAVYMRKYDGFDGHIAALSPCIGKTDEFLRFGEIQYNVTFTRLMEMYRREGGYAQESGFDSQESLVGFWYPTPGGLKESVEQVFGKGFHIKKIEGPRLAQEYLESISKGAAKLPLVIDILNCGEGCSLGTGTEHQKTADEMDAILYSKMKDLQNRKKGLIRKMSPSDIVREFEKVLKLDDFMVCYQDRSSDKLRVSDDELNTTFHRLMKYTDEDKKIDCSACGYETCHEMAIAIALDKNVPNNCIVFNKKEIAEKNEFMLKEAQDYSQNISLSMEIAMKQAHYQKNEVEKLIENLKQLAKGDLNIHADVEAADHDTEEIAANFRQINHSLHSCIEAIHALVDDAGMLADAAVEGRLSTRVDVSKHGGDFAKVVEGMNRTLDSVIDPLNMAALYVNRISKGDIPDKNTDIYNGDFNDIKNNLNTCIDAVNALIEDTRMLTEAAREGRLSARADVSRHGGDFAKIVQGVNMTLDAVIAPINEASDVLQEMARGNLQVMMEGDYRGDHALIKTAMNETISNIRSYVNEISEVLVEVSEGNLYLAITADYKGDFVAIKDSLNNIIVSLNQVIGHIADAAEQVASGSEQVSDGSQALSQGTTEQACAIEELTSTVSEVAAKTKENAVSAGEANSLTLIVKDSADLGSNHMKQMLLAMDEINESSNNISRIIKVIDDIAFQTNILALNAAVEAARAGQHGKGFAVVAEEVRNLAARSAAAAKETTDMIQGSIQKATDGAEIANNTASALEKIVEGVAKTTIIISEIARSSNEQAMGIAQINTGLNQVSQVVQTNAATSEESAAASEELTGQAVLLKEMVGKFRLKKMQRLAGSDVGLLGDTGQIENFATRIVFREKEYDKY
jgi:methyl-accepting chemotaxis protein